MKYIGLSICLVATSLGIALWTWHETRPEEPVETVDSGARYWSDYSTIRVRSLHTSRFLRRVYARTAEWHVATRRRRSHSSAYRRHGNHSSSDKFSGLPCLETRRTAGSPISDTSVLSNRGPMRRRALTIHSSRTRIRAAPECTPSAIFALSRRPAAGRLNSGVRPMHRVLMLLIVFWSGEVSARGGKTPVPKAATRLVTAVHDAAASGTPEALRKFMSSDFVSSFGGDGGPDEAIALWTEDRSYLTHLAQSTAGQCEPQLPDYLECPSQAGLSYRAGFKLADGKWLFFAFVAGD